MSGRFYKLIFTLSAVSLLAGCSDEPLTGEGLLPSPGADMSKFWYSRSRSATENRVMMRHHALGFSYQAITGKKCNVSDVMCQIFNLDYITENGLCYTDNETEQSRESHVERGVADFIHGTKWVTEISADLLLYQKDKIKAYSLLETINDSTIVMHNSVKFRQGASGININLLYDQDSPGVLNELYDYEKLFSENFRYAVDKLRANRENVAVIDSFLNIFGTHVVTRVEIGGKCDISVKTSKRHVHTYLDEQEYSREAVNLFFKKKETIETLTNQTNYVNLFRTAEIDLTISGGDVSKFDLLVANPSYDNALASYDNFEQWGRSVVEAGAGWDEGMELIDMEVIPIYVFMPDEDLAKRVMVRMEASARDMRDLFGELNFTSAEISLTPNIWNSFNTDFYPMCITNPDDIRLSNKYGFCHTIQDASGKPSRIVAVTYYEKIPELGYVHVTYPVYENRIQMTEGIAAYNGVYYNVKWLYDRIVVGKLEGELNGSGKLYLYKGRLFAECPIDDEQWRLTKTMPDYEWAGSLDFNGNLTKGKEHYYQVAKENDNFYLLVLDKSAEPNPQYGIIPNLPGWGYDSNKNRMERNNNYRYKIIPKELRSR